MSRFNGADVFFLVLLAVGGINWGLVGLFDFNLVSYIFGAESVLTNLTYAIVGLSALYTLFFLLPRLSKRESYRMA